MSLLTKVFPLAILGLVIPLTAFPLPQACGDIIFEAGAELVVAGVPRIGITALDAFEGTPNYAFANFESADQTTSSLIYNDVLLTDALTGVAFTFDLIVSPGNGVTDVTATGTINTSLGENDPSDLFEGGDVITVTVSDIQPVNAGDTVNLNGFVNFGVDNSGNNEGFDVNGIDYIRGIATNGDSDPRQGIALPAGVNSIITGTPLLQQSSVDIESIGTVSLRAVAVEFSTVAAVPEPSSLAFLAFGTIGLVTRRRR